MGAALAPSGASAACSVFSWESASLAIALSIEFPPQPASENAKSAADRAKTRVFFNMEGFLSIASTARAVRWAGGMRMQRACVVSRGKAHARCTGTRPAPPCAASLQLGDGVVHVRDVDVVDRDVLSQTLE